MRRMLRVTVMAVVLLLAFATLGWAMTPRWSIQPYADHLAVASPSPDIEPAVRNGAAIPREGRYRTHETRITVDVGDGERLPAVLREPVDAPGNRPACLFIHGSGTSGAEDFGDIANAMASAGIVTLVPAKRGYGYTVLHRDYARFARDYGRALDVLRGTSGVDPSKTGIYAESEGTWIATILASARHDIAFAALTSAPVFKGREQMAMAVSAYADAAGAPEPVVRDTAKLLSLDYAPFGLSYADFDADAHLSALTMPVLVSYGTYDTAMPIEQGARRIMETAHRAGNDNVTVRYFAGNHQMRAGNGLFAPGLPLADGYTQALENWVNGVTIGGAGAGTAGRESVDSAGGLPGMVADHAGRVDGVDGEDDDTPSGTVTGGRPASSFDETKDDTSDDAAWEQAEGWATPQVAGARPSQRFAAPSRTNSGIVGSLGVLVALMAMTPLLLGVSAILGLVMSVIALMSRRRHGVIVPVRGKRAALHVRPVAAIADGSASAPALPCVASARAMRDDAPAVGPATGPLTARARIHAPSRAGFPNDPAYDRPPIAGACWMIGMASMTVLVLLYGYLAGVGAAAVFLKPLPSLFGVGWVTLRLMALVLTVLLAWRFEYLWANRGGIVGIRRAVCVLTVVAALAALTCMAFWGLFDLPL